MQYTLERDGLTLTVSSLGAEVQSLTAFGREWIWEGDPQVWGKHAPLCFPWCGRVRDGWFTVDGKRFEAGAHGFARELDHVLTGRTEDSLSFRLESDDSTLARYPFPFRLDTVHRLEDHALRTTCTVTNTGGGVLPFQIGFHFAFALPLAPGQATTDHRVVFDGPQQAREVKVAPPGLVVGEEPRFPGAAEVTLDDHLFDNDSICLTGLTTRTFRLECAAGPALEVETGDFPYVLLWSKPGPMRFLCIEPWTGIPDRADTDHDFFKRPALTLLQPGESRSMTHLVRLLPR